MKVVKVVLSQLKPLEKNVRKHSDKQIDEFIRALTAHGQTRPFVIDEDNNILIGNGMYAAMLKKGDTEAYAMKKTGLSEKEKKKLILSDNKIFSLGIDDYEGIQEYINSIVEDGDYDIAGYDDDVLKELTRSAEEVIDDVMNYGIDTAYTVEEAPQPVFTPPQQQNAAQTGYNAPQAPVSQPSAVAQENYTRHEVHNDRTIVCPNCGEVIHID